MKKNSVLEFIPIFDGTQDPVDVFADLIAVKIRKTKQKDNIAKEQEERYNEDAVQYFNLASGLCG